MYRVGEIGLPAVSAPGTSTAVSPRYVHSKLLAVIHSVICPSTEQTSLDSSITQTLCKRNSLGRVDNQHYCPSGPPPCGNKDGSGNFIFTFLVLHVYMRISQLYIQKEAEIY